jgi:thioredoxin-like negative regulator of GroEL
MQTAQGPAHSATALCGFEEDEPVTKTIDLDASNFDSVALNEDATVLVDFWSETCPHCLQLNPEFEKAAATGHGDVKFAKVSAQAAMGLLARYDVYAVPAMVLFRGGEEVARREGAATSDDILAWLTQQARSP